MKIKHWQGYGCVNAKKVSCDRNTLVVHVWGQHEYGLKRDDFYDIFNWLVKRFDKTRKNYLEISDCSFEEWYEDEPTENGLPIEHCVYTVRFRNT